MSLWACYVFTTWSSLSHCFVGVIPVIDVTFSWTQCLVAAAFRTWKYPVFPLRVQDNRRFTVHTWRIQTFITLYTCLNSDFYCSYIKDSVWCLPVISQRVTQDSVSPCNKPEVDTGFCVTSLGGFHGQSTSIETGIFGDTTLSLCSKYLHLVKFSIYHQFTGW